MNRRKILPFAFLSLLFAAAVSGQQSPQAVLVDEFGRLACDELLGRLDVFFAELRAVPQAVGLVAVHTSANDRHEGVIVQEIIKAHSKWRGIDQRSLHFVRSDSHRGRLVQLWQVSPGAETPKFEAELRTCELPAERKEPFVLTVETKFGAQICPAIDERAVFASLLKDNPKARGNIVVRGNSSKKARVKAAAIARRLASQYGIPRSKLRTFSAAFQRPSNHDEPVVEYWYLP